MKLNIAKHDFSIIWEGIYYKALSNYPQITQWELKSITDFIHYEKSHGRTVTFEIEDMDLREIVLREVGNDSNPPRPSKITECTACHHKGCLTEFLCHTAPLESAIEILKSGQLLSARKIRKESIQELVDEARNAAKDPADFFDYIMFSWGNCQAGDRLVMERKLNRLPNAEDLSIGFTPGVRFYFKYNHLKTHPRATFDGYHALKIKDALDIAPYLEAIVIPEDYKTLIEDYISNAFIKKVHYLKMDCKDIWDWSEKVYDSICHL